MSVEHKNGDLRTASQQLRIDRSLLSGSLRSVLWSWSLAGALFALALLLRLYRLDAQPLWLDEGETWKTVTRSHLSALLSDLFRPTQAYPLYHLVVKLATRLLGDSEWALRLPSALAGACAVPALFALGLAVRGWVLGLSAALLLLVSPFALWQAQDAKAYSLTLLVAILIALTLMRALHGGTRGRWLLFGTIAAVAPFTHRLLIFNLLGCAIVWGLMSGHPRRRLVLAGAVGLGGALIIGLTFALRYQRAGGQFASVGPLTAGWLTFGQFAVGQWPGAVRKLWLLPWVFLTLVGGLRLLMDVVGGRHKPGPLLVLVLAAFPALVFAVLLLLQPLYEARYFTIVFPFWLLITAWALPEWIELAGQSAAAPGGQRPATNTSEWLGLSRPLALSAWLAAGGSFLAALVISNWALYLPGKGLFSGATVKEDFRGAIRELAGRVHPDDLVIVHPDAIMPLYEYYAPRVSQQPLPTPLRYGWLGRSDNDSERELRAFDAQIRSDLQRYPRAWLLIAPAHATVVDKPKPGDEVGLVGLAFQYGDLNGRLQCNNPAFSRYVGVWLGCNNMPSVNGAAPQPATAQTAVFGDALRLRGYTITPFATGIRPGGTLPLTLFWEPLRSLAGTDYQVFVHLTPIGSPSPLAQLDGRPLEGGLPTGQWTDPGAQLHDERTLQLPPDLPPGRYRLLLGVYRPEDGQRLPVTGTSQPVFDDALLLAEVEVQPGVDPR